MKKKTFISIAVIVVCLALAIVAVAATTGMGIVVEFMNDAADSGETVTAIVSVKNYTTSMAGIQYEFEFDTNQLTFVKAEIDPSFYKQTVKFGATDEDNAKYSSFVSSDASPYFSVSVDDVNHKGKLRFVSIADTDDGSYSGLGKNFTLFTVTLTAATDITKDISKSITPSKDFSIVGAPPSQDGKPVEITIPEGNYTSAPISDLIENFVVNSNNKKVDLKVEVFDQDDLAKDEKADPVKILTVKGADQNGSDTLVLNNLEPGKKYTIKISKPLHLSVTYKNVVIDNTGKLDFKKIYGDVSLIVGDVDNDSVIGMKDLSSVINYQNKDISEIPASESPDVDGDGVCGMKDLSAVINAQNKGEVVTDLESGN